MTQKSSKPNPFIQYLEEHRDDRAMLAALRRGVGKPPGAVPEVSKYVQRRLAEDAPAYLEEAYYLIAPLFALHPAPGGVGDMGAHFAALYEPDEEPPPSVERRFMLLLSAHPDDLADYLRQAVRLLKSKDKEVPVNWQQLLRDVLAWKSPDERRRVQVQRRWARKFWRSRGKSGPTIQTKPNSAKEGE
jgi:CRISPR system Cascade subunit CasB